MDLDLIVGILLVFALAYVIYKAIPLLTVAEPFFVYESRRNDAEHRQILPPNPGLGSLAPDLLPLDKQNAELRGSRAYMSCGKNKGPYPLSTLIDRNDLLQGFIY
jgi:hypothetical protein